MDIELPNGERFDVPDGVSGDLVLHPSRSPFEPPGGLGPSGHDPGEPGGKVWGLIEAIPIDLLAIAGQHGGEQAPGFPPIPFQELDESEPESGVDLREFRGS